jgi:thioredoxin-related protein
MSKPVLSHLLRTVFPGLLAALLILSSTAQADIASGDTAATPDTTTTPAETPEPLSVPFMAPLANVQADLAAMQKHHIPMLLFFHASYCGYCRLVDDDYIEPMRHDPKYQGRLLIRFAQIDDEGTVVDRDGKQEGYMALANRMDIHLVPEVVFFGPDGKEVGEPLRGVTVPDFYPFYLDQGIDQAEECAKNPETEGCTPKRTQRRL